MSAVAEAVMLADPNHQPVDLSPLHPLRGVRRPLGHLVRPLRGTEITTSTHPDGVGQGPCR
eukprot:3940583-Rhodomonas_salina.10